MLNNFDPSSLPQLLEQAANKGARRALAELGLHDENAAEDIRDLRRLLDGWRGAQQVAWQTTVRFFVSALLVVLVIGLAVKLKIETLAYMVNK